MSHLSRTDQRMAALNQQIADLHRRQERLHAALAVLYNIGLACRGQSAYRPVFEVICRELALLFELDACHIAVCDNHHPDVFLAALMIDDGLSEYIEHQPVGPLTSMLLRNRHSLLFSDLHDHAPRLGIIPEYFGHLDRPSRSWLGIPLLIGQDAIGVISLQSYQAGRYDEDDRELLLQVGNLVATILENVRLLQHQSQLSVSLSRQVAERTAENLHLIQQQRRQIATLQSLNDDRERQLRENSRLIEEAHRTAEEAERQAHHMQLVHRISLLLSRHLNQQEILDLASREVVALFGADHTGTLVFDSTMTWGTVVSEYPLGGAVGMRLQQTGNPIIEEMMRTRRPVCIEDTTTDPRAVLARDTLIKLGINSLMIVPLLSRGRLLGSMSVDSIGQVRTFSEQEQDLFLTVAATIAAAIENARLHQESMSRVDQELAIARQIQTNLFPRTLPQSTGLELAAECLPAYETGGDFYDVVSLGHGRLAIMVGDASGKSVPGAMLMAVARSIARSEMRHYETPQLVMRETNRWVAEDVPARSFVALCYAVLDVDRRHLALANAGQLSPIRRRANGCIEYLEPPGPRIPLGILPDQTYQALNLLLDPGDTLIFFTDGIVEAHDEAGALFGFERLEVLLRTYGDLAPDALIAQIKEAVAAFSGSAPPHDDMTLVVLRIV